MTWRYEQATGKLWHLEGQGYSGFEECKNQPDCEDVKDRGPIPRGLWIIGPAFRHPEKGPLVMGLANSRETQTFGRSGFLIHGDMVDPALRGTASHGCIVLPHDVRELIANSDDHDLEVVR